MAEKQTNYTIMEGYELPSKGQIYDIPVNSHVELRSMTARDEMKRLSPSSTPLKTLADIIEGCLIEKPAIPVYDMAIGDYEYLLHKLRIVTYGDSYKIGLVCPYCGESVETEMHLENLDIREFNLDKFSENKIILLPKCNKTVTLKVKTPRMLEEVDSRARELKRKYKDAGIDFETLANLTAMIDFVDGQKLSTIELENFVNTLPALDMQKLLNAADNLNALIGIDNAISVGCPKCNGEIKTFFRFGAEFFRPTNI